MVLRLVDLLPCFGILYQFFVLVLHLPFFRFVIFFMSNAICLSLFILLELP